MEVDGAVVNALSTEEKQRLVKEGKCFTCKKIGHQSRNCPNKDNAPSIAHGGARAGPGTSARATEVEEKKGEKKQELTKCYDRASWTTIFFSPLPIPPFTTVPWALYLRSLTQSSVGLTFRY